MGKLLYIAKQSENPQGWFGHIVARVMAYETAKANRMALEHLDVAEGDTVLEVGFGHGQTVREIARRVGSATIAGVDPTDVMVSVARSKSRAWADRVDLRSRLAESLPFDDGLFDRALTVHTTYFWPQRAPGLREVAVFSVALWPGSGLKTTRLRCGTFRPRSTRFTPSRKWNPS